MIIDQMCFHGINAIEKQSSGWLLHRFSLEVLPYLSDKGASVSKHHHGSEIRFMVQKDATLRLSSLDGNAQAMVYYGDFQERRIALTQEPVSIHLEPPFSDEELAIISPQKYRFHPLMVRVILQGENIMYHGIEGKVRPPKNGELPTRKLLSYGTSITQGHKALLPDLTFVNQLAWRLRADAINMGMSGSAYLEKEMADFIAQTYDADIITLCLSVNLLSLGASIETFFQRADYFIRTLHEKNIHAPIVCISILTNYRDASIDRSKGTKADQNAYRDVLKQIVNQHDNVFYLDGTDLLSFENLSADLLHPGHYGMIEIAENIAKFCECDIH